ncbi:MAG: hypothetical protein JSS97_06545 [Actinobacteria bacterium]|nr:hypothetical protein [Actinomycetota bacterium]
MPGTHTDNLLDRAAKAVALLAAGAVILCAPAPAAAAMRIAPRVGSGTQARADQPSISWRTRVIETDRGMAGSRSCRLVVTDRQGIAAVSFSSPGHPNVSLSARRVSGARFATRQVYTCLVDARQASVDSVPVLAKAKGRRGGSASATAVTAPVTQPAPTEPAPTTPTPPPTSPTQPSSPPPSESPAPPSEPAPTTPTAPTTPPAEPTQPPSTPPAESPVPPSEATTPAAGSSQLFSPSSFWNRQLSPSAPLVPQSATYVQELVRQVAQTGSWINTNEYSTPVYVVGPGQPTSKVTIVPENGAPVDPRQQASLMAVPIPANASPAKGSDRHLVVWQPSTNSMWEFWELRNVGGQWTTDSSGAMDNVSTSVGYFNSESWPGAQKWWGATATSLPLLGGLIRIGELQAGTINHALALAIPDTSSSYVWPAQRSDGRDSASSAIPEGTTFRLPAGVNVESLGLPAAAKAMAYAAQRYGIIVRDSSADVSFYGEDPTPLGTNPYTQLFANQYPNAVLSKFPWSKLVAVQQTP